VIVQSLTGVLSAIRAAMSSPAESASVPPASLAPTSTSPLSARKRRMLADRAEPLHHSRTSETGMSDLTYDNAGLPP